MQFENLDNPTIRSGRNRADKDNLTWEDFSLERFASQGANRFSPNVEPSYIVSIYDIRPEENLGNRHEFLVAKDSTIAQVGFAGLVSKGIKKYLVLFNSIEEAHEFCVNGVKTVSPFWGAFIPDSSVYSIRIIFDIPSDFKLKIWRRPGLFFQTVHP